MNLRKAFKFVLRPNGAQVGLMRQFCGSRRFVFNKGLALQQERYANGEKHLSYADLCKHLTAWKANPATLWLNEVHSQVLQQSLKDLCAAYRNFFEQRSAFPKFKKKGSHDSFRFPQGVKLDEPNSRIFLPKIGWMRYRASRKITGEICQVTVSLRAGTWFVSVQTEAEIEDPVHASSSIVGIDLGVARLATLSDGTIFEAENHHRKAAARLAAAQRRMSRRRKFSRNWKKAKARVQRIQARIARTRHDGLHKASTQISKSHAVIVVEDLKIKNMTGSAAGTVENPGQNVRAKARLNKAILDQGWSRFIGMLEYKQAWRSGWVIAVDPRNTSRTCPSCEHVAAENRKTQAKFACVACGFEDNADLVAARNILRAGHARLACGETSLVRASAQEPTKVTPGLAA